MRYEIQSDGHLRIVIQPTHRLWRIFRDGYDQIIKYNFQGNGVHPIELAMRQLFSDYIGSEKERYVKSTLEIRTSKTPYFKSYMVNWDIDALCRFVIGDYIYQKLFEAQVSLDRKGIELNEQVAKKVLVGDQAKQAVRTSAALFRTSTQILNKMPTLWNGYSILFEGCDDVNTYVFDSREDPFDRSLKHLQQ